MYAKFTNLYFKPWSATKLKSAGKELEAHLSLPIGPLGKPGKGTREGKLSISIALLHSLQIGRFKVTKQQHCTNGLPICNLWKRSQISLKSICTYYMKACEGFVNRGSLSSQRKRNKEMKWHYPFHRSSSEHCEKLILSKIGMKCIFFLGNL